MAVKIRLTRIGSKKKPYYRIVAANSSSPRDGRFIEILGNYDPHQNPHKVSIKMDLMNKWINNGGILTNTVSSLLKKYMKENQETKN